MQNISLDNINPSDLKDFFKNLSVVSTKHEHEHEHQHQISGTPTEKKLQSRIHELEADLAKTKRDRDHALGENRSRIKELNDALVSMKTIIHEMLEAKKHRIRHLERKIGKEVKL